jgi:hypothetical protein
LHAGRVFLLHVACMHGIDGQSLAMHLLGTRALTVLNLVPYSSTVLKYINVARMHARPQQGDKRVHSLLLVCFKQTKKFRGELCFLG